MAQDFSTVWGRTDLFKRLTSAPFFFIFRKFIVLFCGGNNAQTERKPAFQMQVKTFQWILKVYLSVF